jgi:signal transduction histidine kinase
MRVVVDKMRCQQILINLLSNAIKFSKPKDKICIQINKPVHISDAKWLFSVAVKDMGIGLCEADRANLF